MDRPLNALSKRARHDLAPFRRVCPRSPMPRTLAGSAAGGSLDAFLPQAADPGLTAARSAGQQWTRSVLTNRGDDGSRFVGRWSENRENPVFSAAESRQDDMLFLDPLESVEPESGIAASNPVGGTTAPEPPSLLYDTEADASGDPHLGTIGGEPLNLEVSPERRDRALRTSAWLLAASAVVAVGAALGLQGVHLPQDATAKWRPVAAEVRSQVRQHQTAGRMLVNLIVAGEPLAGLARLEDDDGSETAEKAPFRTASTSVKALGRKMAEWSSSGPPKRQGGGS